jgi:hypothetical protein
MQKRPDVLKEETKISFLNPVSFFKVMQHEESVVEFFDEIFIRSARDLDQIIVIADRELF